MYLFIYDYLNAVLRQFGLHRKVVSGFKFFSLWVTVTLCLLWSHSAKGFSSVFLLHSQLAAGAAGLLQRGSLPPTPAPHLCLSHIIRLLLLITWSNACGGGGGGNSAGTALVSSRSSVFRSEVRLSQCSYSCPPQAVRLCLCLWQPWEEQPCVSSCHALPCP